jgi:hypothetical protein
MRARLRMRLLALMLGLPPSPLRVALVEAAGDSRTAQGATPDPMATVNIAFGSSGSISTRFTRRALVTPALRPSLRR